MPPARTLLRILLLLTPAVATHSFAQAPLPFTLRLTQAQTVINIADGAAVTFPSDAIGSPSSATLTVIYRGTATAAITLAELTGSLDFIVTGLPELPVTLAPNEAVTAVMRYLPTASARAFARLTFSFTEGTRSGTFSANLTGTAPEFAFSYVPPGGNATALVTGGTVLFPATAVDATATATIVVANRGSGAGSVLSVGLSGAIFQLTGVPLLPATVEAGRDARFGVAFTPRQLEAAQGTLTVELFDRRLTFALEGTGSGPLFAYQVATDSGATAVQPNQLLAVPDIAVGEKSSLLVRFRNNGNADGRIAAISISGTGFTLSDVPFLPLTLAPGATGSLTVTFAPTTPGRATGRLRIGNDNFDLAASGLGAILNYAYITGGVTTTVAASGTAFFPPAPVGGSTAVRFQISNTGTASQAIGSIALATTATVFTLSELPSLPTIVPAGGSVSFSVNFVPAAVAAATATLRIDTASFTLSGTGLSPNPIPPYRFDGATGAQEPLQQPAVGLRLDASYPLSLTGTLTLAFNSEVFSNDPSVQFATGGRTVSFTIPANSTRAVFPNNETQIRLQTGTVAGTITLTPSFATAEGGISLTPVNPPALSQTVAQSAPRVLSVLVSARGANSITLLVTGYTTARSITQMDLQFTPVSGETVTTSRLSVNVESTFLAWYQSAQSQQFGSLFTATVPLTATGDVRSVTNPGETLQSIQVSLTNRFGASAARSVDLR